MSRNGPTRVTYENDGITEVLFFLGNLAQIFHSDEEEQEQGQGESVTARKVRQAVGGGREGEPEFKMNSKEAELVNDLLARSKEYENMSPEERSEKMSKEVESLGKKNLKDAADVAGQLTPEQKARLPEQLAAAADRGHAGKDKDTKDVALEEVTQASIGKAPDTPARPSASLGKRVSGVSGGGIVVGQPGGQSVTRG